MTVMAKGIHVFLSFFLALCAVSRGLSILRETVECRGHCGRTYPPHTYPTARHFRACQQGCYQAVKSKAWSLFGSRSPNCSEGCKRQYFDTGSISACTLGCKKGHDISTGKEIPTFSAETVPAKNQGHGTVAAIILRPVMFLHTYGRGMIDRFTYYVQSSTSYYFRTDNGGMVVVNMQNEPEVYISASEYNKHPVIQKDKPKKEAWKKEHSYTEHHESWIVVRRGHHWLHCVSHKSGVPMWILTSVLFLSSFFLLWLCCATTVTSPSIKKPKKKKAFLIKDFVQGSKEKDGEDVPLLELDYDEQPAGPLPSKTAPGVI